MKGTKVQGHDADPQPLTSEVEVKCPVTGAVSRRPRTAADPIVWTEEAWQRLQLVPLIARPLARNTVERLDRKSTRLNSSHPSISYAVLCLKKKNQLAGRKDSGEVDLANAVGLLVLDLLDD